MKKLSVLVYHRLIHVRAALLNISGVDRPYCLTREKFVKQMNFLRCHGFKAIKVSEIFGNRENRVIGITFDDGLLSDYDIALPELRERGFGGTFFIVSGYVGRNGYMDWGQIKGLHDAGMEIGSHGYSHQCLLQMNRHEIEQELIRSKEEIEAHIGQRVGSFAVPFGLVDRFIIESAFEVGYEAVCTSETAIVSRSDMPKIYGRYGIRNGCSMKTFMGIANMKPATLKKINLLARGKYYLKNSLGLESWLKYREKILNLTT
jgi:peptidoglycan/xylan/chitin deacetylase (PgdA/CDA1 family)